MSQQKPRELRRVVIFIVIIMVSWLVYWILKAYFLKQWMIEDLLLILLCIIFIIMFYRLRGVLTFSVSLLVFTVFALLGVFFSLYGLTPLLSDVLSKKINSETAAIRAAPHLVNLITGVLSTSIVFLLLTSEDLNSYLGTEAIFPLRREKRLKPGETKARKP
ncbi:MAG: hypothetical protein FGF53_02310 [Candidatus Brockarchaeota archaeon]|nr:hypothetical protein [Candidatus Brockarchaeota archaeon]MBO3808146.1 hypothetical protein [Candidatus Brockarchaeota archaeon]